MSKNEISSYYDKFNLNHKGTYRNLRHYKLINLLFKEGLNRKTNFLEIGCGSGPISEVIANYVSKGSFLGMDISEECVKILQKKFNHKKNVDFICSDLADFNTTQKFEMILLADVLEHIPIEIHNEVFNMLSNFSTDNCKVVINIPTCELINWQKVNEPEKLQIIDQALPTYHILSKAYENGFIPIYSLKHKLFHEENDYEMIVLQKITNKINFTTRDKLQIIIDKFKYRFLVFIKTRI